jgi:tetratricopeptide (TPR) repeat protein
MSSDSTPISEDDYSETPADVELVAAETPQLQVESEPGESFWSRLRNLLGWGVNRHQRRLEDLFTAIIANPDSSANYALRGELYLQIGEYELALADFEIAQKLASEHLAVDNWGLIAQVLQDRALIDLAQAKRHLEKRS